MVTPRRGATKLGCLVYVVLVAAVLYFGVHVGQVYFRYLEYKEAMQQELRFRTLHTDDQIKTRFKSLADSLGLPEEAGDVTVTREAGVIRLEAQYTEVIDLRFLQRQIRFEPRAKGTY